MKKEKQEKEGIRNRLFRFKCYRVSRFYSLFRCGNTTRDFVEIGIAFVKGFWVIVVRGEKDELV